MVPGRPFQQHPQRSRSTQATIATGSIRATVNRVVDRGPRSVRSVPRLVPGFLQRLRSGWRLGRCPDRPRARPRPGPGLGPQRATRPSASPGGVAEDEVLIHPSGHFAWRCRPGNKPEPGERSLPPLGHLRPFRQLPTTQRPAEGLGRIEFGEQAEGGPAPLDPRSEILGPALAKPLLGVVEHRGGGLAISNF